MGQHSRRWQRNPSSFPIIKNSYTSYTAIAIVASVPVQLNFTFISDTQGMLGMIGNGMNFSISITKKQ